MRAILLVPLSCWGISGGQDTAQQPVPPNWPQYRDPPGDPPTGHGVPASYQPDQARPAPVGGGGGHDAYPHYQQYHQAQAREYQQQQQQYQPYQQQYQQPQQQPVPQSQQQAQSQPVQQQPIPTQPAQPQQGKVQQQQQQYPPYEPPPAPVYEHQPPKGAPVAAKNQKPIYSNEGGMPHVNPHVNQQPSSPPGYPIMPPIVPKGQFVNSSLVNVKLSDPSTKSGGSMPGPPNLQQVHGGHPYGHPPAPIMAHPPFYGAEYNQMVPPVAYPHQTLGGQYAAHPPPMGMAAPPGYVPQPQQGQIWGQGGPIVPAQYLKQTQDGRALYETQAFVPMNNSADVGSENLAAEWERVMTDFLPDMIVTFKLASGESEHFNQDVGAEPVLIRGGFFESTDDHASSIKFQIVSPSGKVVYKSTKGEGLFKIQTEESGTYTFALSNGNWSGLKYVTFVIGTGTERSLSQEDISTLDGNIKVLYRMLGDMETQSTYLWLRQKSHLEEIKKTATQTYYVLIVELGCTALATIIQLGVIKKMVSHRRLF